MASYVWAKHSTDSVGDNTIGHASGSQFTDFVYSPLAGFAAGPCVQNSSAINMEYSVASQPPTLNHDSSCMRTQACHATLNSLGFAQLSHPLTCPIYFLFKSGCNLSNWVSNDDQTWALQERCMTLYYSKASFYTNRASFLKPSLNVWIARALYKAFDAWWSGGVQTCLTPLYALETRQIRRRWSYLHCLKQPLQTQCCECGPQQTSSSDCWARCYLLNLHPLRMGISDHQNIPPWMALHSQCAPWTLDHGLLGQYHNDMHAADGNFLLTWHVSQDLTHF